MAIIKKEVELDSLHDEFDIKFTFIQDGHFTTVRVVADSSTSWISGEIIPTHMDLLCEAWMEFKRQVKGE